MATSALLIGCRELSSPSGGGTAGPPGTAPSPPAPATPLAAPQPIVVRAQPFSGKTIAVQIGGGLPAQVIREKVQPGFEADHDVKLVVEEGTGGELAARSRGEKEGPPILAVGLDEPAVRALVQEGLLAKLDPAEMPNLLDVYPEHILENRHAVGFGVGWVTAWCNAQRVKTPPDSYEAFWDLRYRARIAVPSIASNPGLLWLIIAAALASGKPLAEAQYNVEPGFERWRQLKPNLHSTYESFKPVAALLAQGEVWMGFGYSTYANAFILKGAPIERLQPQEGAFLNRSALALVKHPSLEPLGRDLINRLLSPEIQSEFARAAMMGPVNRKATIPGELAKLLPVGSEAASAAVALDWGFIAQYRSAWAERWNQEIGA